MYKYDIYFASPFFREDQIEREERLKKALRDLGFKVYSPKESCNLGATASLEDQQTTFNDNVSAIEDCNAVFCVTDTKDIGSIWEAGCAYALGKPIIYYAETLGNNQFNLMLAQSGNLVITDQSLLDKDKITRAMNGHVYPYSGLIE